ncbi:MAG: response regulator transcription factor, partial [Vallitaleaceae bacterium]|nr:response regulator transcription factor [Vallitaleaceae bacterium]
DVNLLLSTALLSEGYEVDSVFNGKDGLNAVTQYSYQLVLLDLMLPYKSGDVLLKELRAFSEVPVIVISAKGLVETKVALLKLGADDYITKPFNLDEVLARVASNIRRAHNQEDVNHLLTYKDIILDTRAKSVVVNGIPLELTAKEYMILEYLMQNQYTVASKAMIYELLWQESYLGDDNVIKIHISNIRSKLRKTGNCDHYIETVWGLGYRLSKE